MILVYIIITLSYINNINIKKKILNFNYILNLYLTFNNRNNVYLIIILLISLLDSGHLKFEIYNKTKIVIITIFILLIYMNSIINNINNLIKSLLSTLIPPPGPWSNLVVRGPVYPLLIKI